MTEARLPGHGVRGWIAAAGAMLGALSFAARPATAQSRLSADVALELGGVRGGEYRDRAKAAFSMALDVRVARFDETSVWLGVRAEDPVLREAVTAICVPGSHGQCLDPPPSLRAVTINVGVRRRFLDRIAVGAGIGVGGFAAGQWSGWRGATSGSVDVALCLGGPLYAVIGGHVLAWSYGGSQLSAPAVTYGLRLN